MPESTALNQVINPDGTVSYDFDGHIHADGLDLDAGTSTVSITDDNRVRWVNVGGAMVADIVAWELNNGGGLVLRRDSSISQYIQATLECSVDNNGGTVSAVTGKSDGSSRQVVILDYNGNGDFVRTAASRDPLPAGWTPPAASARRSMSAVDLTQLFEYTVTLTSDLLDAGIIRRA